MTTCGYFWTIVVIVLAVVSVAASAVRGEKRGGTTSTAKAVSEAGNVTRDSRVSILPQTRQAAGDGKRAAETGPVAYRRGGERYVTCSASTRLDDGYIVSLGGQSGTDLARMTSYAKKELAAVLAEQALAAGGIEFSVVGGELHAYMRTVTGREGGEP